MKRVEEMYMDFIGNHPIFADTEFVMSDAQALQLKRMARVEGRTLALCNAGRNDYHFLHTSCPEFSHLFCGTVTVEEFVKAILPGDIEHFVTAWCKAFRFVGALSTEELFDYALVFECRLLNIHGEYKRVMFKYLLMEDHSEGDHGQVLLMLKPVDGSSSSELSKGIYIINLHTGTFVKHATDCGFSDRELQIASLSKSGYNRAAIADKLFIAHDTVDNHRRNINQKLSVREISFAVMYLHDMGVI
jgi:Response regulator containing a CheY-like receiver domain and an HTH DNA-binding domain